MAFFFYILFFLLPDDVIFFDNFNSEDVAITAT